jgi:hypothetical protein
MIFVSDDLLKKLVFDLERGHYIVIHTNEVVELKVGKPTREIIRKEISTPERECVCCDTVTLRMGGNGNTKDSIVMFVDDTGILDGLPVNRMASELYWLRCTPWTTQTMHGTAVVVNDADFA